MADWLEYRLEKLAFHNGAILGFKKARMLYRDDDREILIERLGAPPPAVDKVLRQVQSDRTPIRTIYYEMRVKGYPPENFFYHPMGRGARVYLEQRKSGENVLFFNNADGNTLFSKEWTLRDVTQGRIPLDKAVWQFHGYKHEH